MLGGWLCRCLVCPCRALTLGHLRIMLELTHSSQETAVRGREQGNSGRPLYLLICMGFPLLFFPLSTINLLVLSYLI